MALHGTYPAGRLSTIGMRQMISVPATSVKNNRVLFAPDAVPAAAAAAGVAAVGRMCMANPPMAGGRLASPPPAPVAATGAAAGPGGRAFAPKEIMIAL